MTLWTSSLPGSFVRGILQARILEWVATSFPRRSPPPRIGPLSFMSPALADWIFTPGATGEVPYPLCFTRTLQDYILEKIHLLLPWPQWWSKSKIALFSEPCEVLFTLLWPPVKYVLTHEGHTHGSVNLMCFSCPPSVCLSVTLFLSLSFPLLFFLLICAHVAEWGDGHKWSTLALHT